MFRKKFSRCPARGSFARYKIRNQVQGTIQKSAERIRVVESEVEQSKTDLTAARSNPNADKLNLTMLENSLAGMERSLSEFKVAHEQFVQQQARPSQLFPRGITASAERIPKSEQE